MSKYEKYISSGIDFLGDIPNHWKRKRIKDVSDTIAGGTPDTGKEAYWEGDIPWLPSGKVQNCIINKEDADTFITELGLKNSATKMLPYPSVLVALTGATCSNIGYLTFDACANQSVVGMPGSKQLNPSYLFYTLQSQKEQILLHQTGGAQGGISERNVKFLFIPLPTPDEQLAIANYLDNQTQKIDRLIANKKAQAEKLKELRQIEINNAVTKGLNPNDEMKDSGIEWLGKIPKHWDVKRLKDLVNKIGDGIHSTPNYVDVSEIYFVNGNNLINGEIKIFDNTDCIDEAEFLKYKLDFNLGTLLISINGTIGNLAFYKGEKIVLGKSAAYIDYTSKLNNYYLYYFLQSYMVSNIFELSFSGTTIKNLSLFTMRNLRMFLPPKEEQIKIANYLQERTGAIDKLIKNVETQIEKLQELRKIKIYEAVTGKIKVNAYVEATA
jgi:type I restriction enzyme S subunit